MSPSERTTSTTRPCKFLRSKEMYHEELGAGESEFDSDAFWCMKTQEAFGPDGVEAEKAQCVPGRNCYKC
jgi:hypothetical protein